MLKSKNKVVMVVDETIDLGSRKVQLVVIGAKADLAVDGIFLNSKKEYTPIDDLPKYTWIFVGACMLPLIVFRGGALNFLLGLSGSILCITNTMSQKRSTSAKIILNIIITTFVWLLDITIALFLIEAFA